MSENDALDLAQERPARMGSGAESAEIAKLLNDTLSSVLFSPTCPSA
jgi:hypothetical protein